jgi:hypothetical protein
MSVDEHPRRAPVRRGTEQTYFVGRRLFEASEVYAVTATAVDRLRSGRRYGEQSLDWHGGPAARMELSHVLIGRVAEGRPSRELEARFALYVLGRQPDGGFVLHADDVWRWLRLASEPEDFAPAPPRRSWLRGLFGGEATVGVDA